MYRKSKKHKYIFALLLIFSLLFSSFYDGQIVFAEDEEAGAEESEQEIERKIPADSMYESEYGVYKDEDVDYTLDLVSPDQIEDEGFLDKVWNTVTLKFVSDGFSEGFHYALFTILKFFFSFNLFMTNAMIGILNFAYDTNLVNTLIDALGSTITSMTGISDWKFTSSGLYGGFIGVIGVFVAFYTLYQFIVKRATISAFGALLKSILALTIALVFFSNYTTIIKGINTLSIEASALILSGSAETVVTDGNIVNTTVKEKMNDNLFNMFVHKPYLMLQYGTTDTDTIGEERLYSLLKEKNGTASRQIRAVEEVLDHGNDMLTYPKLLERLNFMGVVLISNAFNSIPVYLLSLCLIVFQFWFIVIAMVAPFALLWASLPNQFGVLKRYTFELSIPLILKMGVSFLALLIFGFSELMYALTSLGSGSFGIVLSTIIQGLLLLTLFLLRKRIFSIFSLGSTQLNSIREEMGNTFVQPFKKGVQTTAATAGAIGGAVVGGPQGAMVGMNMGSSIGNAVTGESDMSDTARNVGMSMYMAEKMKGKQKGTNGSHNMESREVRLQSNEEKVMELAENDTSYNRLKSYLQSKDLPTETVNETLLAVDKLNLDNIETEEMQKQYNKIAYLTEQGKGNNNLFADSFAKGLKINREQQAIRANARNSKVTNDMSRAQVASSKETGQDEIKSEYSFKTYSLDHIPENFEEPQEVEYRLENDN